MIELAVMAGVVGVTGTAIATGISLGSRYINEKLRYEQTMVRGDRPVVVPPPNPREIKWDKPEAA